MKQKLSHFSVWAAYQTDFWALPPEFLRQAVWGGASESAFLPSSQVALRLPVRKLYFENY